MTGPSARAAILAAALDVFAAVGYEAATVAAVRRRAGVSNGSFFHFFRTKDDLAGALYLEGIAAYQRAVLDVLTERPADARAGIAAFIRTHLDWVERHRHWARFLFDRGRPDVAGSRGPEIVRANAAFADEIQTWAVPLARRGELRTFDPEALAALLIGPVQFIARAWLVGRSTTSPSRHAQALVRAAVAALVPSAKTKEIDSCRRSRSRLSRAASGTPSRSRGS